MAKCDYCGATLLFGGVYDEDLRFCNQNCRDGGRLLKISRRMPHDAVEEYLQEMHQGDCPKCGGPGPVDVHTSYTIWSAVYLTSWRSKPQVCCQSCGTKAKMGSALSSAVLGWWGFPFGFIMTPVQIIRNFAGLFSNPDPDEPSEQLEKIVRLTLAEHMVDAQHREARREEKRRKP